MPELIDKMRDIFTQVQLSKRNHPQCLAKLKKCYEKVDSKVFAKAYITCLAAPLSHAEKHPKIENTLDFAAKFAISVCSFTNEGEEEEELCPFWSELFDFLLSHHNVEDAAIRFRLCYFLNMLLNSMGDNAFIDDTLCDRITSTMIQRLLDKVPRIRAQAILALHRLQDPSDDNCPVIKAFIFHLSKDPQAEVRKAVLHILAKNRQTLAAVLRRTRDINEGVRKLAYQFLTKITVRSLRIEQREQLLKDGLRDRSERVSKYVKNQLLPVWLENYGGEFIKLLEALDAEKALDTSILMLEVLFKATVMRTIIEQVPVNENTKLIPFNKLTSESVIYWRCTVEHLNRDGFQEGVENILTDLSKFCKYIREFIEFMNQGDREYWEVTTLQFILLQLFEITKTYDLSDEVGRENLRVLIIDVLKSDNDSEPLIDCIVQYLASIIPDTETRLNVLAEVISEIRMPLAETAAPISETERLEREMKRAKYKVQLMQIQEEQYDAVKTKDYIKADELNKKVEILKGIVDELSSEPVQTEEEEVPLKSDEKTLVKCLQIMYSMMQSVRTLYPLLRSLFADMVLPSLDHSSDRVVILSIKATTVCCLFDVNLAKTHLPLFFIQFGVENNDIWLVSLKGLFDLLVFHGLEGLGMLEDSESEGTDGQANQSRKHKSFRLYNNSDDIDMPSGGPQLSIGNSKKNIIHILTALLDNVNQELRTIAVEGLCKLLLHRRISSGPLLSRLIILWHNPVTNDDAYLRQCLSYFFNHFPVVVPNSQQMMERSFLPTLKILAKAPATSPLNDIDPVKVAQLILYMIRFENQHHPLSYSPHNHLALAIIAEALNDDSDIDPGVLIRSLRFLNVNLEDQSTIKCLQEAVDKLEAKVDTVDKRAFNTIMYFKKKLYGENAEMELEDEQLTEDERIVEDEQIIEDESEDNDE